MLQTILAKFKADKQDDKTDKEMYGYNPYLLSKIQPQGGIKFPEAYTRKGDGYETTIHIYEFPTVVSDFWLEQIMNIPNVVASLDVTTPNRKEIMENINKSMSEQKLRGENAKDTSDLIEAANSYDELEEIYNDIRKGEVMKRTILRLYVSAKTIYELEFSVKEVIDTLESLNYRGSVFLNEQEYEWESLFTSFSTQQNYPNKRKGLEIQSLSLAAGFPFHFTSLSDPYGTHYGTTDTNGNVIFDIFHKDAKRKFYNALIIGKMGSGKSTMLKKVVLDNAIKGEKIRVLDVTGEFGELVNKLDGKQVALDGSEGVINPLQVFKTVTHEDGSPDEKSSFTQHISKMSVFYNFLNSSADNDQVKEFKILLRKLYKDKNLWSDEENEVFNITDIPTDEYPIFSDFLQLVREELYEDIDKEVIHKNLSSYRSKRLESIKLTIEDLVQNYGSIFDGVSSIKSFDEERIVSFPLRNLTNLEPNIYQAQIFNIMNMLWDGMIVDGSPQFKAYNRGEVDFQDVMKYLIVIDEAHHLINTKDISQPAVEYLTKFMREARKYFGGIFFASHLITDFVPENADQSNAEEVKKLFGLTQYKFIGEQDRDRKSVV